MTRRWLAWLPFVAAAQQHPVLPSGPTSGPHVVAPNAASNRFEFLDPTNQVVVYQEANGNTFLSHNTPRNGQCPVCGLVSKEKIDSWIKFDSQGKFTRGKRSEVVRCARCSAAFWQDSEDFNQ